MKISILSPKDNSRWDKFLHENSSGLIYYSSFYRNFLHEVLRDTESLYLFAEDENTIYGILPILFIQGQFGCVANSLPFYGSHGSIITKGEKENRRQAQRLLIEHALEVCRARSVVSYTLINNPLINTDDTDWYSKFDLFDKRIGQFSDLPQQGSQAAVEAALLAQMHQKTRNMVRKSLKKDFRISVEDSDDAWGFLCTVHEENMQAIGGKAKPPRVFESLRGNLPHESMRRLYISHSGNQMAAGLLVLFFNGVAEYFTPVIKQEFRSDQPLSGLIFRGMTDATLNQCKLWNWGGAWASQDGVYRFKKRWGTKDLEYQYLTKIWNTDILRKSPTELLENYPFFFVAPFNALIANDTK